MKPDVSHLSNQELEQERHTMRVECAKSYETWKRMADVMLALDAEHVRRATGLSEGQQVHSSDAVLDRAIDGITDVDCYNESTGMFALRDKEPESRPPSVIQKLFVSGEQMWADVKVADTTYVVSVPVSELTTIKEAE